MTSPREASSPVHCSLFLDARHPAGSPDRSRVAAQEHLSAGLRERDEKKDFAKALSHFEAALPLWRTAGDAEGEVDTGNEVSATEFWLNQPDRAAQEARGAAEKAHRAGYAAGEATALNNLGNALGLRQPEAALAAYRRAIALWKALGIPAEQGDSTYNLGFLLYRRFELDEARKVFEDSLPLRQGDPARLAYSLTGLGLVSEGQGDVDKALDYYQRARDTWPGDPTILSNMAAIHFRRGELQEALNLYDQSLAQGLPKGWGQAAEILHNLASLYVSLGEPEKALAHYKRVLDLQQGDSRTTAITWTSLGTVLFNLGRREEAREDWERALDLSRRSGNAEAEAQVLHNLGRLHMDTEPEIALAELDQSLKLYSGRPDFAVRAGTLVDIGTLQTKLGRLDQGAASLNRALELASRIKARPLISRCLLGQAKLARARGRLDVAQEKARQALENVEKVRSDVGSDDLRTSFFAANREYYDLYIDLLLQEADSPGGHPESLAQAFVASEQARARGLRDLLAEARINVDAGVDPALRQEEEALANQLVWTERQWRQIQQAPVPDEKAARPLQEKLLEIDQKQKVLVDRIRQQNPRYAETQYPGQPDVRHIQESLDAATALLEYAVGPERSVLFVVTRENLAAYPLPFGSHALADRVGRLRRALKSPNPAFKSAYLREAAALYRDLVAPGERSFGSKSKLLLSPDGSLHLLPFEALLTASPQDSDFSRLPYLLRRYAMTYVPSASVLAGLQSSRAHSATAKRSGAKALVAFANSITELGPLPESEREVRAIAGLFPGRARLYLGREATKDEIQKKILAVPRVHFAVHGILNEQWPQLSGLALTREPNQEDDGFLRVHDIFKLKLDADLVVLSACDTEGSQVNGEGLVGLTRAFFYAGASSLVVSLWKAAEASAPDVMVAFYRGMERKSKAEALQEAKLDLIRGDRYAHPFYWAPFILIGDPR